MSVPAAMRSMHSANAVHFVPSLVTPMISLACSMPSVPAIAIASAVMIDGVVRLGRRS